MMTKRWAIDSFARTKDQVDGFYGAWCNPVEILIETSPPSSTIDISVRDLDTGTMVRLSEDQLTFLVQRWYEQPISSYDHRWPLLKWMQGLVHDNRKFFPERRRPR